MLEQLKEDIEQYNEAMEEYYSLVPEDLDIAYDLAIRFMQIANRWVEIRLQANKICLETGVKRTDFKDYAYEKYRLASKAHDFCRVVWKQGKEDLKNTFLREE